MTLTENHLNGNTVLVGTFFLPGIDAPDDATHNAGCLVVGFIGFEVEDDLHMPFHNRFTKPKGTVLVNGNIVPSHIVGYVGSSPRSTCHIPMRQVLRVDEPSKLVLRITNE